MRSRVLSWASARRRRAQVLWQGNQIVVDPPHESELEAAADNSPSFTVRLPLEIWLLIADLMASDEIGRRCLVPLTQVCKDFRYVAEEALYCRVSVGPHILQLRSFLQAVCGSERRAAAVRALQIRVPSVVFSSVRPTVLQKLSGHSSTYAAAASRAHYSVDARQMGNLAGVLEEAFGLLVNLKELDFIDYNDLQAFPVVFTSAAFRLTELKTTGNALSKATACVHARTCFRPSHPPQSLSPSPLASVTRLTVDVSNGCLHLPVSDLQLHSVTHLFLDRALFGAIPDLRRTLAALPNLSSLKIVWAGFQGYNHAASTLWPTHLLGDEPVRRLRRLELSEWRTQRPYRPIPTDLNADVDAHLLRLRGLCPSITSLVWWPSEYHRDLAATGAERPTSFSEALWRYTVRIFATWPTLERFERLKLECQEPVFTAFVRGPDGRVADHPSVFCPELWRDV
ncbi:hypothetical protein OH76DRAFT_214902 [Lentinus brumalis]|uniref:Uncharacterized protein n=1 Tax=Lentinus brumalis TaxID=2498619 RepID=A0A371CMJ8_9APHY|nr:hypothetical protein OH76DRAFT_214902 [Polyporus brumalis]